MFRLLQGASHAAKDIDQNCSVPDCICFTSSTFCEESQNNRHKVIYLLQHNNELDMYSTDSISTHTSLLLMTE